MAKNQRRVRLAFPQLADHTFNHHSESNIRRDISEFDDNILQEILSRLPAKYVNQSKLVCKSWNNLISCPIFINAQAARSINNVLGLLTVSAVHSGAKPWYIPIEPPLGYHEPPYIEYSRTMSILAACNGLIFYVLRNSVNVEGFRKYINSVNVQGYDGKYILRNLSTNSSSIIHRNHLVMSLSQARFGLAFDPLFQASTKIVGCVFLVDSITFCMYSPYANEKEWRWSRVTLPCTDFDLFDTVSSTFTNGALHWLRKNGSILAYNVAGDRVYNMQLPSEVKPSVINGYLDVWLGVVRGNLCAVKIFQGIHIWEMKDCSSGAHGKWELKKHIEMPKGQKGYYEINVPLVYDGNKCVVLRFNNDQRQSGVAVYRIWEKKWDEKIRWERWMDKRRHFVPFISHSIVD